MKILKRIFIVFLCTVLLTTSVLTPKVTSNATVVTTLTLSQILISLMVASGIYITADMLYTDTDGNTALVPDIEDEWADYYRSQFSVLSSSPDDPDDDPDDDDAWDNFLNEVSNFSSLSLTTGVMSYLAPLIASGIVWYNSLTTAGDNLISNGSSFPSNVYFGSYVVNGLTPNLSGTCYQYLQSLSQEDFVYMYRSSSTNYTARVIDMKDVYYDATGYPIGIFTSTNTGYAFNVVVGSDDAYYYMTTASSSNSGYCVEDGYYSVYGISSAVTLTPYDWYGLIFTSSSLTYMFSTAMQYYDLTSFKLTDFSTTTIYEGITQSTVYQIPKTATVEDALVLPPMPMYIPNDYTSMDFTGIQVDEAIDYDAYKSLDFISQDDLNEIPDNYNDGMTVEDLNTLLQEQILSEDDSPNEVPDEDIGVDPYYDDYFNSDDPSPDPDPDPDYNPGEITIDDLILPSSIIDKFPFCIPFDLYSAFQLFSSSEREAPSFEYPIVVNGVTHYIVFDLSIYDDAAAIFRNMMLLLFIVSLALGTRKLLLT